MPKKIGKILTDIIPEQHHWKVKLLSSWDSIIGTLKDKVRIENISESSLTLGVCHATWAQELFFLTPVLKKKINKILQEEKIKNIKFKTVGRAGEKKSFMPRKKEKTQKNHVEHSLTIVEHSTLQDIENKELAAALEKFYIRCKKISKKDF